MKILGYCLLCLFATRVQSKPQITKLFPAEGLAAYQKQFNSTTKSVDNFWEKLRTTYNFVFRYSNNTSNVEKILKRNATDSNLQSLKLIWADTQKADNYTNLRYPNNSFLEQVKSLFILKNHDNKEYSNSLKKDSTIEIKATIKTNGDNVTFARSNKTKTLPDDDWFNDIEPLEHLELQDEELDKKNEVEIVTPGTTLLLPTTIGHHLLEWLGSLFGFTYGIYTKLSSTACDEKMSH
ncbi:uncharacterized protein [Cardiocondyla obscurior]|uniref:uncharacterized protein n=1 Tax=Cardiocondyla obscurior TaxID=286306 RepID=UPI0039656147